MAQSFARMLEFLRTSQQAAPLPEPAALADFRRLSDTLTGRRDTVPFIRKLEDTSLGLRFASNAWLIHQPSASVYLQKHPRTGFMWPPGGGMDVEDAQNPATTALRECNEESPHLAFLRLLPTQPHMLDVTFKVSEIPGKAGEWCYFTMGFWVMDNDTDAGGDGCWTPLKSLVESPDVGLSRPARRSLALIQAA